jgi:Domain of unknown function (DUF4404)
MDPNTLREQLARLHDELADAHRENPAARQSLDEILPQVKNLVDQPGADASSAGKSLRERLEGVAVQFEAEHPKLAANARSLIALLSEVGI